MSVAQEAERVSVSVPFITYHVLGIILMYEFVYCISLLLVFGLGHFYYFAYFGVV